MGECAAWMEARFLCSLPLSNIPVLFCVQISEFLFHYVGDDFRKTIRMFIFGLFSISVHILWIFIQKFVGIQRLVEIMQSSDRYAYCVHPSRVKVSQV